jgi:AcrR family transcriptional regulator
VPAARIAVVRSATSRAGCSRTVTPSIPAREAGCSTRIVSHHFSDKHELLLLVFRDFSERSLLACEAALAAGGDLSTVLEAVLPLDEARRVSWQVWIAFWGRIADDPEFRAAQVERAHDMRQLIERALAVHRPAVPDPGFAADHLLTILVGIATQGVFDPDRWDADRQRQHLRREIARLGEAIP